MLPAFGAGLRRFLFEPNTVTTHRRIEEAVVQSLDRWERRIQVGEVRVEADPQDVRAALVTVRYTLVPEPRRRPAAVARSTRGLTGAITMPLPEPTFDSCNCREILAEALARIPAHTPEWTNFNDSDPGITLLQLFAFLTESIIYRANLIPERNRNKFLRLLGVPMQAASPARGLIAFERAGAELQVTTLEAGLTLYAGNVPFRTGDGLDVLPVAARLYYKSLLPPARAAEVATLYRQLYASQLAAGETAEYYETRSFAPSVAGSALASLDLGTETVDGSLWVALLARPRDDVDAVRACLAGKTLTLGMMPALADGGDVLYPRGERVRRPADPGLRAAECAVDASCVPAVVAAHRRRPAQHAGRRRAAAAGGGGARLLDRPRPARGRRWRLSAVARRHRRRAAPRYLAAYPLAPGVRERRCQPPGAGAAQLGRH
ncbi:MAG: GPW/gp25 family protein [Comamonadaceae bacterium]|nr:GPW/gp25 family protein [Comamonadaceae bacterium]